jgi:hypothetical protein
MKEILQGKDRSILIHEGLVPEGPARTQPTIAPGAMSVTAKPTPPPSTDSI